MFHLILGIISHLTSIKALMWIIAGLITFLLSGAVVINLHQPSEAEELAKFLEFLRK